VAHKHNAAATSVNVGVAGKEARGWRRVLKLLFFRSGAAEGLLADSAYCIQPQVCGGPHLLTIRVFEQSLCSTS
jgi:hypothetical protein